MFSNLGALQPEDKIIVRAPRATTKAQIDFTRNYKGEKSQLLQELADKPLLDDLPF